MLKLELLRSLLNSEIISQGSCLSAGLLYKNSEKASFD